MNDHEYFEKYGYFPTEQQIRAVSEFEDSAIIWCSGYNPLGEPDQCSMNCMRLEIQHGGEAITGWRFMIYPWEGTQGMMSISAHVVWRAPNGVIYDPTPHVNAWGHVVCGDGLPFVEDELSFVTDQRIIPLSNNKELRKHCRREQVEVNQFCGMFFRRLQQSSPGTPLVEFARKMRESERAEILREVAS